MSELKRTALYDAHVAAGGTMVDFGGWEMPIQYPKGIVTEHLNTRKNCGIFDVSHMGRLLVEGPDRIAFLQKVLTSNVASLKMNRAQYCIIPNETGGAIDDAYLYMFEEDRLLLVVNASNTDKDLAYFDTVIGNYNCTITNMTARTASIAVQGPKSTEMLRILSGQEFITDDARNSLNILQMEGHTVWVSKTGYTGEPLGYELFVTAEDAEWLWNRLIELGGMPTGLGARDTLRLEACLPLYGHEMGVDPDEREIPIFAVPLSRFAVSFAEEKGDFVGKEALLKQSEAVKRISNKDYSDMDILPMRIAAIALKDRGVMRAGMPIYHNREMVGWLTSGTMVPYYNFEGEGEGAVQLETTGKRAIGMAYINSDIPVGEIVEVDIRGRYLEAVTVSCHMRNNKPPYAQPVLSK
ncbi:MAG: glycine cleavage system aminomethyltransferase GcvT [Ruminococcaceae bacterium]|nr:glycine cleavage system aminomethyltransferase GcvT [Oscillospiraceae bacterium]